MKFTFLPSELFSVIFGVYTYRGRVYVSKIGFERLRRLQNK